MKLEHTSASSIERFADCPANWVTAYDKNLRVNSRNQWSDMGTILHTSLQLWRNPNQTTYSNDYAGLEQAFEAALVEHCYGETFEMHKRAKELLAAAYKMTQSHPTVPIQLAIVIVVEQEFLWQMPGWKLPLKGAMDAISMIPIPGQPPNEIIILGEDYKSGRPMTHSELVDEKIQPGAYMLYVRDQFVPYIEKQICSDNGLPWSVKRIVFAWDYIQDGTAVAMYESDFDLEAISEYIAGIIEQQLEVVNRWNDFNDKMHDRFSDVPMEAGYDEEVQQFLEQYEKPNSYCAYCPRKGSCKTFSRLLDYNSVIDITAPETSWDEIWEDYQRFQAIAKEANNRMDAIKGIVPVYLDQQRLESIPLTNGLEITATRENRKEYRVNDVRRILGEKFIIESAKITQTAIDRELALIAKTDIERSRLLETELQGAYTNSPGARPVRSRKIDGRRKK